jgi:hypothetical protein
MAFSSSVTVSVVVGQEHSVSPPATVFVLVQCDRVTVDLITVMVGPLTMTVFSLPETVDKKGHTDTLTVDWMQAGQGGQLTSEHGIVKGRMVMMVVVPTSGSDEVTFGHP